MDGSEWIGFFIALAALGMMTLKEIIKGRQKSKQPNEEEDSTVLNDFLKSLEGDMQEAKKIERERKKSPQKRIATPPPLQKKASQRTVRDQYAYKADLDEEKLTTKIEGRQLPLHVKGNRFQGVEEQIIASDFREITVDPYAITDKSHISEGATFVRHLKSRKQLLLSQMIMGPPKGLENRIDAHDYFRLFPPF